MRILGIDPGLANTGYGVIEQNGGSLRLLDYGCVTTVPATPFQDRLLHIHKCISAVINEFSPEACAIETVYFGKNATSAFQVGHARGVLVLAAATAGVSTFEYTPLEIKKALVGTGSADKAQLQFMTKAILSLQEIPKPDHASDALGVAICHANVSRFMAAVVKR